MENSIFRGTEFTRVIFYDCPKIIDCLNDKGEKIEFYPVSEGNSKNLNTKRLSHYEKYASLLNADFSKIDTDHFLMWYKESKDKYDYLYPSKYQPNAVLVGWELKCLVGGYQTTQIYLQYPKRFEKQMKANNSSNFFSLDIKDCIWETKKSTWSNGSIECKHLNLFAHPTVDGAVTHVLYNKGKEPIGYEIMNVLAESEEFVFAECKVIEIERFD